MGKNSRLLLCTGPDTAGGLPAFWVPSFKEHTEKLEHVKSVTEEKGCGNHVA